MTNQPIKPVELDPKKLHSPSEVRQFKAETADYFQALRDIEQSRNVKAQAEHAHQNKTLDDDEYFALAVKRKAENDAKIAERLATEKAAALAHIDHLLSSPPTIEIMHRSEFAFLKEVIHWANRGYVMPDSGFLAMMPGMFHIVMDAPAKSKACK